MLPLVFALLVVVCSGFYYFYRTKQKPNYDVMTKMELMNHIRSNPSRRKLNHTSNHYYPTLKDVSLKYKNLIPMCFELYDAVFEKTSYKPNNKMTMEEKIGEAVNKKKFYCIRPTGDFKEKFYATVTRRRFCDANNLLNFDPVPAPINVMKVGFVGKNEYEVSFKEAEIDKCDYIGVNERLLQNLNEETQLLFLREFNKMLSERTNVNPTSFGKLYFSYKVNKSGEKDDVDSFRQIISLPKAVSLFHRILNKRLVDYLAENNYIDTTIQKGAMPGTKYGIPEHLYKVKSVFKDAFKYQKPAFVLFLDIKNAFGTLYLDQLYHIMGKYHIPSELIDYVKEFHRSFEYFTELDDKNSPINKWNDGLVQGSPLSPVLFVIVMNYILKHLDQKYCNTHGYEYHNRRKILFTAFIDDVCVMTDSFAHLNQVYTELKEIFEKAGLEISTGKSAYLSINDNNNQQFNGIEKKEFYKYLGEYLTDTSSPDYAHKKFVAELRGKLKRLDDNQNVETNDKASIFTRYIYPIVLRKGIALYDIGDANMDKTIEMIKSYTDKWNVTTVEITKENIFKNIKDLLRDSTDNLVGDILRDDTYEYVKEKQSNLDKLFKRPKKVVNITYNDITDTTLVDRVLDSIEKNVDEDAELNNVEH
jgi:hypothetical protein